MGSTYDCSRLDREILETDKCDWCQKKKAIITDKRYVYCSDACQKLFLEDVFRAMEE